MLELEDVSPGWIEDLIDPIFLRESLDEDEYAEILDEDHNIDFNQLLDNLNGLQYVKDEAWIRVKYNGTIKYEVNAHDILSSLFYYPNQYEGIYSSIISDEYLGIFASVAGGQGGGFAVINIESGEWIFQTNEFAIEHILWIPNHQVFVCIHDVPTYAWHSISLVLINLSGEICSLDLYSHNHFKDDRPYNPNELSLLTKISNEDATKKSEPALRYDLDDDSLHLNIYGHWECNFHQLIDAAAFEGMNLSGA